MMWTQGFSKGSMREKKRSGAGPLRWTSPEVGIGKHSCGRNEGLKIGLRTSDPIALDDKGLMDIDKEKQMAKQRDKVSKPLLPLLRLMSSLELDFAAKKTATSNDNCQILRNNSFVSKGSSIREARKRTIHTEALGKLGFD